MAAPYAQLLVVLGAGSPQTGAIVTTTGTTVTLSGASVIGWNQQRFEIWGPPGFAGPAGWSTDPVSGAFFSVAMNPPSFTASVWGKYMLRLLVNGGLNGDGQADVTLVDTSTALSIYSPTLGLRDLGWLEGPQFNATHLWQGDLAGNLRLIETLATGAVLGLSSSTPAAVGTSGVVGTATTAAHGDHVHPLPFATVQSVLGAATGPLAFNAEPLTHLGSLTLDASVLSPTFGQAQLGGTGAAAGQTWTWTGQQGQQQTGAAANNNGGTLVFAGGLPGTGGSGAAGEQGQVVLNASLVQVNAPVGIGADLILNPAATPQTTTDGSTVTLAEIPITWTGKIARIDYYVEAKILGDTSHITGGIFQRVVAVGVSSNGTISGGFEVCLDPVANVPFATFTYASQVTSLLAGGVAASVSGSNLLIQAKGVATVTFASVMGGVVPPGFISNGGLVYYTAGGTDSGSAGPSGTTSPQTVGTVTYRYEGTSPISIDWTVTDSSQRTS